MLLLLNASSALPSNKQSLQQHPFVKELWEHAKRWNWDYAAIHAHIFRLCDSLVSSKECVEDLFGKGADLKRSNKNPFKAGSTERFHFNNSHWIRLPGDEWPKMMIERDDVTTVQNQPRRTHVNLGTSAPNGLVLKTLRAAALKKRKGYPAWFHFGSISTF